MTAVSQAPEAPESSGSPGSDVEGQRLSFRRRLWNAYIYGSTPVLVLLAFICALVIGAILIVISDDPTRTAMGYFFQHPSDTFTRGWHAISLAYSQLFQGSVFN